ncbi:MAG: response regulator transcription factor [Clostridia bacterium]|nr:response regulator transcription factor [Clostridia bacterium]
MKKILIAEDEASIREFIVINLQRAGFEVIETENGLDAIDAFDADPDSFDVCLLDIMMPGADGLDVCAHIRSVNSVVGIIMLTARTQETDKINGLNVGADDYVVKPFSIAELMARVESVCRRVSVSREAAKNVASSGEVLASGNFKLNMRTRTLAFGEKVTDLTQVEFQIMEYFFRNPGKVLSRSDILRQVWGDSYYGEEKVVDVNIRRLRKKIERDPSNPDYLVTVWGAGYKWE